MTLVVAVDELSAEVGSKDQELTVTVSRDHRTRSSYKVHDQRLKGIPMALRVTGPLGDSLKRPSNLSLLNAR